MVVFAFLPSFQIASASTTDQEFQILTPTGYKSISDVKVGDEVSAFDFQTNQNWRVLLSTANNAYATIDILKNTLREIGERPVEYIDLRIENRVYYKPL